MKTDVKDDAGKQAKWDETFQLPNILTEYRDVVSLVFEAYDKDIASSDLLGSTDPLDVVDLVKDETVHEWSLEIFDMKGDQCGSLNISTQLITVKADPPLFKNINYNCQLEIKLLQAEFLKDEGDALGKQDPFLQFVYETRTYKTAVKDDAGLKATYDDVFLLENVEE